MKIGAQMFTMRDFIQTESDMEYSFEKVAKMGYTTMQLSGVNNYDPKKVRAIADKNGLEIVLTHSGHDKFITDIDGLIETNEILGCKYVGIGSMMTKYRDPNFIHRFAEDYIPLAEKIKAAGKYFMYHNHSFEFEKIGPNGENMLDIILKDIPADLMGVTLDTYWIHHAGADVCDWLDRLHDRIPCVHLKDMTIVNNNLIMAPVYEGNLDFDKIIKKIEDIGKTEYMLVEQDNCVGSAFDCLETSCKNLIAKGYK